MTVSSHSSRLSLLWNEIRGDFETFGFYVDGEGISSRQEGVFRVNCIDCLDRTNVVQGVLARIHLEHLLRRLRLLDDSSTLPNRYPKVTSICLSTASRRVHYQAILANLSDVLGQGDTRIDTPGTSADFRMLPNIYS